MVNFAHKCTQLRTRATGLGFRDRRDGAVCPERARLPAGERGGPAGGAARPGRRTRLRHAPVEPWKNPGAHGRGGPARQDGGNKGGPRPDAVMEKPNGAPGRGRQGRGGARPAALPPSPAGPGGAAPSLRPGALLAGGGRGAGWRPGKTENAGSGREARAWGQRSSSPLGPDAFGREAREGGPGLVPARHTQRCTRPPGSCGSRGWPARRGRTQTRASARTRVRRRTHAPPAHTGSFTRTCAPTRGLPIAPRAEREKGAGREGPTEMFVRAVPGFRNRSSEAGGGTLVEAAVGPPPPLRIAGAGTGPPGRTTCPGSARDWSFPPVRDASCPGLARPCEPGCSTAGVFYVEKESVGSRRT